MLTVAVVLTTVQYVDHVLLSHNEANGAESKMTLFFVEFMR